MYLGVRSDNEERFSSRSGPSQIGVALFVKLRVATRIKRGVCGKKIPERAKWKKPSYNWQNLQANVATLKPAGGTFDQYFSPTIEKCIRQLAPRNDPNAFCRKSALLVQAGHMCVFSSRT